MIEINLKSAFRFIQAVAPGMCERGSGSIVNIASIAGLRPQFHGMLYSMTKAALIMMTQSYALELGPHGVRVNAIAPGLVQTVLSEYFWKDEDQAAPDHRRSADQASRTAATRLPKSRSCWPSDRGSYLTGQTLVVDGGRLPALVRTSVTFRPVQAVASRAATLVCPLDNPQRTQAIMESMICTRRDIGKLALAALPAARSWAAKPNSRIRRRTGGHQRALQLPQHPGDGGRHPGLHDPAQYQRRRIAPAAGGGVPEGAHPVGRARGAARGHPPAAHDANKRPSRQRLPRRRRNGASPSPWTASRPSARSTRTAGVLIQIVKYDGINTFKDDVVDYCFQVAKALGAHAISCEIPVSQTERLGAIRRKAQDDGGLSRPRQPDQSGSLRPTGSVGAGVHILANTTAPTWTSATSSPPPELLLRRGSRPHHERVTHVHIKDRKANNGPNMPFGQGDTPIKEILLMMKKEKYKFQATIEMEYPVPRRLHAARRRSASACDIARTFSPDPAAADFTLPPHRITPVIARMVRRLQNSGRVPSHPPANSLSYHARRRQRRGPCHTGGPPFRQRGHRERRATLWGLGRFSDIRVETIDRARRRGRRLSCHSRSRSTPFRGETQAESLWRPTRRSAGQP